jgi:hypothetical protein
LLLSRERVALPGGGAVTRPLFYKPDALKDARWREAGVVMLYRHLRSMMSGTMECDGAIAIARMEAHADIDAFVNTARGALTTRWAFGDERGWGDKAVRLPVERRVGARGPEIVGELSVHMVGFWDVYDKLGCFLAIEHARGVRVAAWIFNQHGGERRARAIVEAVAAAYAER